MEHEKVHHDGGPGQRSLVHANKCAIQLMRGPHNQLVAEGPGAPAHKPCQRLKAPCPTPSQHCCFNIVGIVFILLVGDGGWGCAGGTGLPLCSGLHHPAAPNQPTPRTDPHTSPMQSGVTTSAKAKVHNNKLTQDSVSTRVSGAVAMHMSRHATVQYRPPKVHVCKRGRRRRKQNMSCRGQSLPQQP